jgi:hypothetical protein
MSARDRARKERRRQARASAAGASSRSAAGSRRAGRPARRASGHSPWAWGLLALAVAGIIAGAFAAVGGGGGTSNASPFHSAGGPLAASSAADAETALSGIQRVSSAPLEDGGRPVLFFMGGQFCPFCAADRWAFVRATSRFGTWTGLRPLRSQSGVDGFASLPTYDLVNAQYTSPYISLRHKEVADVAGNRLQPLDGFESQLVDAYDQGGSIPFTVTGGPSGQYTVQLAYSPGLLNGQSYDGIGQALAAQQNTQLVKAIDAEADAMTALLCKLSGGNPASACSAPAISALAGQLP